MPNLPCWSVCIVPVDSSSCTPSITTKGILTIRWLVLTAHRRSMSYALYEARCSISLTYTRRSPLVACRRARTSTLPTKHRLKIRAIIILESTQILVIPTQALLTRLSLVPTYAFTRLPRRRGIPNDTLSRSGHPYTQLAQCGRQLYLCIRRTLSLPPLLLS